MPLLAPPSQQHAMQRCAGQQPSGEGRCRHQRQQRPDRLRGRHCSCKWRDATAAGWQSCLPCWQLWQAGIAPGCGAGAAGGSGGGSSSPLGLLGRLKAARPSPLLLGSHVSEQRGVKQEQGCTEQAASGRHSALGLWCSGGRHREGEWWAGASYATAAATDTLVGLQSRPWPAWPAICILVLPGGWIALNCGPQCRARHSIRSSSP